MENYIELNLPDDPDPIMIHESFWDTRIVYPPPKTHKDEG